MTKRTSQSKQTGKLTASWNEPACLLRVFTCVCFLHVHAHVLRICSHTHTQCAPTLVGRHCSTIYICTSNCHAIAHTLPFRHTYHTEHSVRERHPSQQTNMEAPYYKREQQTMAPVPTNKNGGAVLQARATNNGRVGGQDSPGLNVSNHKIQVEAWLRATKSKH